ncbi:hypothetical protein AYO41_00685 [Verrucomicrobia bacterium SCGC AG-212-E04]|nr:hypothetical protein AYO41_00685 [Verrucomicrobia bacterium SCGC AG-212-E04]
MKTKLLVALGLILGVASSGAASPNEEVEKVVASFYAQYYKECLRKPAKGDSDKALIRWVTANSYLSDGFKKALRKAVVDARKEDPEMGLDFDPILNAQDYPEKGYRAKDIQANGDKASVTMEGLDAPDFKISVQLVKTDNKWKIDRIGDINSSAK